MSEGTNRRRTQDVAVIGGSAAGFFTAYLLACRRLHVRVFERADRLDPTPRTLIVTSRMRELLGSLGKKAVVNEIRRFELFANGHVVTVPLQRPDLIIERSTLIRKVAEHAEAAGAQTLLGRRFLTLEPNGKNLTLVVERSRGGGTEEVRARTVIGADGAFSRVASAAGWPGQPTVPLVQAIVPLPKDLPPDTTRVWFIPEDTPYFYWLIPDSPTRGALGLIGEENQQTRLCLERFLEKQGLEPVEFQGARIPLYTQGVHFHRQVGNGDVYLVGDAAGQVKVTTVGGIVTGFHGALGVAEAILNGGLSRELRALRRELAIHLLVRKAIHHFNEVDYSRLLGLLNRSARQLLSVYSRDKAGTLLWSLFLRQPRLLLLGVRGLLTSGLPPPTAR
ncbi:MAG: FAD-dependent monooxygenase [Candidatus Methylomirabilales bacterium]